MLKTYSCVMCVSFHSDFHSGCTFYLIFSLLRFSMTAYTLSFQKDFIFSVQLLSDRFLINVDHLFSILLFTLFCCQTLLCLYASCRINFLMLINLPSDFSKQHRIVCWVVLPADSSIRSIGKMGFRSNIREYGA